MVDFTARTSYRGTAELAPNSSRTRRSAYEESRNNEMREALKGAVANAASRQEVGAGGSAGQNSAVAGTDRSIGWTIFSKKESGAGKSTPPEAGTAAAGGELQAEPLAAPMTRAEADAQVVQSLKDALTAAGISFEGLGLAAHEDVVTYPGGSYIHRYISVNTNGHVEGLMTDLVAINPKVAVLDIRRMLGMG